MQEALRWEHASKPSPQAPQHSHAKRFPLNLALLLPCPSSQHFRSLPTPLRKSRPCNCPRILLALLRKPPSSNSCALLPLYLLPSPSCPWRRTSLFLSLSSSSNSPTLLPRFSLPSLLPSNNNNRLFAHRERILYREKLRSQSLLWLENCNRESANHAAARESGTAPSTRTLISLRSMSRSKPWRQREAPLLRLLNHTPVLFNEKETTSKFPHPWRRTV